MKKKHPIRQRKKGDKISHDFKIPLPQITGSKKGVEINLTMTAYPDDWKKLTLFSPNDHDMKYLGQLFYLNAINPVYEKKIKHIDTRYARGIHAVSSGGKEDESEADFMHSSRKFVAAAIVVVSHWIEEPENKWSSYFSKLISKLKKDEIINTRTKKYNETKIVYRLWENRFKKRRRKQGIIFPENSKFFYRTYIYRNSNMVAAKAYFSKLGTNSTIEDIEKCLI